MYMAAPFLKYTYGWDIANVCIHLLLYPTFIVYYRHEWKSGLFRETVYFPIRGSPVDIWTTGSLVWWPIYSWCRGLHYAELRTWITQIIYRFSDIPNYVFVAIRTDRRGNVLYERNAETNANDSWSDQQDNKYLAAYLKRWLLSSNRLRFHSDILRNNASNMFWSASEADTRERIQDFDLGWGWSGGSHFQLLL